MILGIDLDNTIISYDDIFYREAVLRKWIPSSTKPTKEAVKASILAAQGNEAWTRLQGEIYGPLLNQAIVFAGFPAFLKAAREDGHRVEIVSHKSQFPARGPSFDLRKAALSWLEGNRLLTPSLLGIKNLHFCDSREEKIEKIRALACDVFIDDLVEVLEHPSFPQETRRILFAPTSSAGSSTKWRHLSSWADAHAFLSPVTTLSP